MRFRTRAQKFNFKINNFTEVFLTERETCKKFREQKNLGLKEKFRVETVAFVNYVAKKKRKRTRNRSE